MWLRNTENGHHMKIDWFFFCSLDLFISRSHSCGTSSHPCERREIETNQNSNMELLAEKRACVSAQQWHWFGPLLLTSVIRDICIVLFDFDSNLFAFAVEQQPIAIQFLSWPIQLKVYLIKINEIVEQLILLPHLDMGVDFSMFSIHSFFNRVECSFANMVGKYMKIEYSDLFIRVSGIQSLPMQWKLWLRQTYQNISTSIITSAHAFWANIEIAGSAVTIRTRIGRNKWQKIKKHIRDRKIGLFMKIWLWLKLIVAVSELFPSSSIALRHMQRSIQTVRLAYGQASTSDATPITTCTFSCSFLFALAMYRGTFPNRNRTLLTISRH